MSQIIESYYNEAINYAKKLAYSQELIPYKGPLFDYVSFLIPILSSLSQIPGFPKGPLYLLIDDAHWLQKTQAKVLNSWVATRTSRKVSLKISTQYNYKTYYTISGAPIETPHDYSEIDITTIYTGSNKSKYRERITAIVNKRLEMVGINNISPDQFFPEDIEQEKKIQEIAEEYNKKFDEGKGKGFYRTDDALRYARPDYIKNLGGRKKASSKYSYAGFNQLVHLSSGIIRHFIHPAHLMYAEATKSGEITKFIPPGIQDEIVREYANAFLFSDIDKLKKKDKNDYSSEELLEQSVNEETDPEDFRKLTNLINGLGGLFRQILLSDRSERRVFSIAFSDAPSKNVTDILDLGIQFGYFHRSTIGKKDPKSGGRTKLYILNRRLAPIWNLDPTSFAGYLFVTNRLIEEALVKPDSLLRRLNKEGIPDETGIIQLELFSEDTFYENR